MSQPASRVSDESDRIEKSISVLSDARAAGAQWEWSSMHLITLRAIPFALRAIPFTPRTIPFTIADEWVAPCQHPHVEVAW